MYVHFNVTFKFTNRVKMNDKIKEHISELTNKFMNTFSYVLKMDK